MRVIQWAVMDSADFRVMAAFVSTGIDGRRTHAGWSTGSGFWAQRTFTADERASMEKGVLYVIPTVRSFRADQVLSDTNLWPLVQFVSVRVDDWPRT